MPGLLLILLVAQLLDGAHCAEHHLGRQLCVMRCHRALLAARIPVGIPIQARIRVGVRARIGHVIVVQIATAAALLRHVRSRARVSVSVLNDMDLDLDLDLDTADTVVILLRS